MTVQLAEIIKIPAQETNKLDTPEDAQKDPRVLRIGGILKGMVYVFANTNNPSINPIDGDMQDYDIENKATVEPGRLRPTIQWELFKSGLWLQGTTEQYIYDEASDEETVLEWSHRLRISSVDDQLHTYTKKKINLRGKTEPAIAHMVGIDQIAAHDDIDFHLGQLVKSVRHERDTGLRNRLSPESLRRAHKPHIVR